MKKNHNLLFFCLFAIAFMAFFSIYGNVQINKNIEKKETKLFFWNQEIAKIELEAKAISIYDITNRDFVYGKNEDLALPLASLTKIMTAHVALNNLDINEDIILSPNSIKQDGDSGLFAHEKWDLKDLIELTLISSSNDGAYALAENIPDILNNMNIKAKKIGMENTVFYNATGLDMDRGVGALGSAKDMNILADFALRANPDIFTNTKNSIFQIKSKSGFLHTVENTNILTKKFNNIIFSKTGYTALTGGNLCVIFKTKNNTDIAITLLGSSFDGRFVDMEKLMNLLYNY